MIPIDHQKKKQQYKKWYDSHKEEAIQRVKDYRAKHIDQYKKYGKEYREKNKTKMQKYGSVYNSTHKKEMSIKDGHNPDFSPNQHETKMHLSLTEKQSIVSTLVSSRPLANKNNRMSSRKGVTYFSSRGKWCASMRTKMVDTRKFFNTMEEAIKYREYLENTYYTEEQLYIRDKYMHERGNIK